jgi:hypothetical protein
MKWMTSAVATAFLALFAQPARAETLPILVDVPTTYTPGTAFSFEVRVPELIDFSAYRLDLIFATDVTNPPLFAEGVAAGTNYAFPSSAGFQSTLTTFNDSNLVQLTIADSTSPSVNVTMNSNDRLATIIVTPGAELRGPISVSIGADTLFSFNDENTNFTTPEPFTIGQADTGGQNPGPAPASALLLGTGALMLGLRRRLVLA